MGNYVELGKLQYIIYSINEVVPTKEISKLVLFVRCTYRWPFDWQYFQLFCNLQYAEFCFVFFGTYIGFPNCECEC